MGVEFDPAELYASGVESVPRGHKTTGNGAALSEVLDREVNRRNIDVSRGCRVTALHTDEHGCVRGVVLDRSEDRRGGKEGVSTCRYRWSAESSKKTIKVQKKLP